MASMGILSTGWKRYFGMAQNQAGRSSNSTGLLLLHIDPRDWDGNLERAKEFLDLLPGNSPYRPGLLLVMIAHKAQQFPRTWVSKVGLKSDKCHRD
jgi:hypothetical protein